VDKPHPKPEPTDPRSLLPNVAGGCSLGFELKREPTETRSLRPNGAGGCSLGLELKREPTETRSLRPNEAGDCSLGLPPKPEPTETRSLRPNGAGDCSLGLQPQGGDAKLKSLAASHPSRPGLAESLRHPAVQASCRIPMASQRSSLSPVRGGGVKPGARAPGKRGRALMVLSPTGRRWFHPVFHAATPPRWGSQRDGLRAPLANLGLAPQALRLRPVRGFGSRETPRGGRSVIARPEFAVAIRSWSPGKALRMGCALCTAGLKSVR
jgi:hypothetical protein